MIYNQYSNSVICKLLSNFSSSKTQTHISKVYSLLATGLLTAGVAGYISSYGFIPYQLIYFVLICTVIAELVFLFTRHSKFSKEVLSPINYFATTAATGAGVGLIFTIPMSPSDLVELKSIFLSAFIFTASIFITMTIFAMLTVRRTQIFFGCIIASLVLSIIGIFITNVTTSAIFGLIIGVLYVIVDTQLMINKAESGLFEPFEDARHLYYNLLRIFLQIIVLLSKDKKKKE